MRPIVVFPHPDSPTRPSVLPRRMVRVTSETAFTVPTSRRSTAPEVTGNSFTVWSRTSSSAGAAASSARRSPVTGARGRAESGPTGWKHAYG